MANDDWEVGYEHVPGVYANVVHSWHTAHEFTLDFGVAEPSVIDAVARIRLPTTVVFDLLKTISNDLAIYEEQWGEIARPAYAADTAARRFRGDARPGGR